MKLITQIFVALLVILIFAILSSKDNKQPPSMLSDYQEAYYIYLKNNPECATEFSKIMDSLHVNK